MVTKKKKKLPKTKPEKNKLFWLVGIAIVFIFFSYTIWGEDGLMRLWKLKTVRNQMSEENKNLLLNNLSYLQEIESLKESRYVEQIARSELGMIRNDEVIVIVKPKDSENKKDN